MPFKQRGSSKPRFSRLITVERGEWPALAWAFAYFFCLLGGYYILRPVRDTMGITGGVEQLHWLFSATFLVMCAAVPLYGWATSRFARTALLGSVYGFFTATLLLFYALFRLTEAETYTARAFFVWASVYNLFVISVFWSFMADIFTARQARRLFPVIAAGGTTGAIVGPLVTSTLAERLGTLNLLPVSAGSLLVALLCIHRLRRWQRGQPRQQPSTSHDADTDEQALHGSALAGLRQLLASRFLLGIALFIVLLTTLSTFVYFAQAHIVDARLSDRDEQTWVFALIDLAVNALTLLCQVAVTHQLIRRLGLGITLALVPVIMAFGFLMLSLTPALWVIVLVQIARRAGDYAVTRPCRETLFTVVSRAEKYKAKNVIDTVIYRGGDAVSAWLFAGLMALGLGLGGIALLGALMACAWAGLGIWLGQAHVALGAQSHAERRSASSS